MVIMDNSVTEVYVALENIFRFLPVIRYYGNAPVVNYNGAAIICQYSRQKIEGAYKQNPYSGEIMPVSSRKNFWYI